MQPLIAGDVERVFLFGLTVEEVRQLQQVVLDLTEKC